MIPPAALHIADSSFLYMYSAVPAAATTPPDTMFISASLAEVRKMDVSVAHRSSALQRFLTRFSCYRSIVKTSCLDGTRSISMTLGFFEALSKGLFDLPQEPGWGIERRGLSSTMSVVSRIFDIYTSSNLSSIHGRTDLYHVHIRKKVWK